MAKSKGSKASAPAIDIVGKTVAVTGKLISMTREEAIEALDALGASVSDSISKNTAYLFVGERACSKLGRAQALGIPVLDEEALCAAVGRPFEAPPATPQERARQMRFLQSRGFSPSLLRQLVDRE